MSDRERILQRLEEIIPPILEMENMELVELQFFRRGKSWYLRIFIDKAGGISLRDCELISRQIEIVLDAENLIETRYFIEVSSPGLDRPLKTERDFIRSIDRELDITTRSPVDLVYNHQGILKKVERDKITLELKDGTLREICLDNIIKALQTIKMPDKK